MKTQPTSEAIAAAAMQAPSWTADQEAIIAAFVAEGNTRIQAIRKMQAGKTPGAAKPAVTATKVKSAKAPKAAKPKAEKKAKRAERDLPESCTDVVKATRDELDGVIRAALKSAHGKVCPVIAVLGQRFTEPSKTSGYPFYRVLADTPDGLQVVFVGGFYKGGDGPSASIKPAVKSSPTVKAALARVARATKRAAEALKADAK